MGCVSVMPTGWTTVSARTMQRFASSTLKPFSLAGCASFNAASAARRKGAASAVCPSSTCSASRERHGTVPTPPSATRARSILPPFTLMHDRCRGQSEFVGGAIAQLQIVRARVRSGSRKRDADNQVARLQNSLAIRCRTRLEIKVVNGNAALALSRLAPGSSLRAP